PLRGRDGEGGNMKVAAASFPPPNPPPTRDGVLPVSAPGDSEAGNTRLRGGREQVLSVRNLSTEVATPEGARLVVENLSFDLAEGETLCIAGESGSGKTMTALSIMRLLPERIARIAKGEVRLGGRDLV